MLMDASPRTRPSSIVLNDEKVHITSKRGVLPQLDASAAKPKGQSIQLLNIESITIKNKLVKHYKEILQAKQQSQRSKEHTEKSSSNIDSREWAHFYDTPMYSFDHTLYDQKNFITKMDLNRR